MQPSSHPWRDHLGFDSPQPGRPARAFAALRLSTGQTVAAHPPFGKKSSTTTVGEEGKVSKERDIVERGDFWTTTSNKQLNFVQHAKTLLKQNGRAAVVVPDNVLFEGGAGETIRRKLRHECALLRSRIPCSAPRSRARYPWCARSPERRSTGPSLHLRLTHILLRLPTGLFYAQGVKANVLFFDKKPASETPWTNKPWIYDLRTNMHFTLKTNPLRHEDLDELVECFNPANRHDRKAAWTEKRSPDGRWRAYDYKDLIARDKASLDIFWLRDDSLSDSDNLPSPEVIAQEIVEDLEAALEQFRLIATE